MNDWHINTCTVGFSFLSSNLSAGEEYQLTLLYKITWSNGNHTR